MTLAGSLHASLLARAQLDLIAWCVASTYQPIRRNAGKEMLKADRVTLEVFSDFV